MTHKSRNHAGQGPVLAPRYGRLNERPQASLLNAGKFGLESQEFFFLLRGAPIPAVSKVPRFQRLCRKVVRPHSQGTSEWAAS